MSALPSAGRAEGRPWYKCLQPLSGCVVGFIFGLVLHALLMNSLPATGSHSLATLDISSRLMTLVIMVLFWAVQAALFDDKRLQCGGSEDLYVRPFRYGIIFFLAFFGLFVAGVALTQGWIKMYFTTLAVAIVPLLLEIILGWDVLFIKLRRVIVKLLRRIGR